MFLRRSKNRKEQSNKDEIKLMGTPLRAVVTDIIVKRNGYIVTALYEDRWLGTQNNYSSELLKTKPNVYIGGEVTVYVDSRIGGTYCLEC